MIFTKIEDAKVTINRKGMYKIHDVYECEGLLYYSISGGYVQLKDRKETSLLGIRWVDFDGLNVKRAPVFSALEVDYGKSN